MSEISTKEFILRAGTAFSVAATGCGESIDNKAQVASEQPTTAKHANTAITPALKGFVDPKTGNHITWQPPEWYIDPAANTTNSPDLKSLQKEPSSNAVYLPTYGVKLPKTTEQKELSRQEFANLLHNEAYAVVNNLQERAEPRQVEDIIRAFEILANTFGEGSKIAFLQDGLVIQNKEGVYYAFPDPRRPTDNFETLQRTIHELIKIDILNSEPQGTIVTILNGIVTVKRPDRNEPVEYLEQEFYNPTQFKIIADTGGIDWYDSYAIQDAATNQGLDEATINAIEWEIAHLDGELGDIYVALNPEWPDQITQLSISDIYKLLVARGFKDLTFITFDQPK